MEQNEKNVAATEQELDVEAKPNEELLALIAKALVLEGGEATPEKRETIKWMLSQRNHCDAFLKHFAKKSNELLEENQKLKAELEEEKRTRDNYWQHIVWMRTSEDMKPKAVPCPICGSAHVDLEGSVCSREFFVWCLDCYAMGPARPSESAAIFAWNKGEGITRDDDGEAEPGADEEE